MSPPKQDNRPRPADLVNIKQLVEDVGAGQKLLGSARSGLPQLDDTKIVSRVLALTHEDASVAEMEFVLHYSVGIFTHDVAQSSGIVKDKYRKILRDHPGLKKNILKEWDSISEDRKWFREALTTIAGRKRAAAKELRSELPSDPTDYLVVIPGMVWTGKSLTRTDKIAALSVRGICNYVIMLLLDPKRDFGNALRRCKLISCNRFFLSFASASGGPRPIYCEPEHRILATKLTAPKRTARWRANQPQKKRGKK